MATDPFDTASGSFSGDFDKHEEYCRTFAKLLSSVLAYIESVLYGEKEETFPVCANGNALIDADFTKELELWRKHFLHLRVRGYSCARLRSPNLSTQDAHVTAGIAAFGTGPRLDPGFFDDFDHEARPASPYLYFPEIKTKDYGRLEIVGQGLSKNLFSPPIGQFDAASTQEILSDSNFIYELDGITWEYVKQGVADLYSAAANKHSPLWIHFTLQFQNDLHYAILVKRGKSLSKVPKLTSSNDVIVACRNQTCNVLAPKTPSYDVDSVLLFFHGATGTDARLCKDAKQLFKKPETKTPLDDTVSEITFLESTGEPEDDQLVTLLAEAALDKIAEDVWMDARPTLLPRVRTTIRAPVHPKMIPGTTGFQSAASARFATYKPISTQVSPLMLPALHPAFALRARTAAVSINSNAMPPDRVGCTSAALQNARLPGLHILPGQPQRVAKRGNQRTRQLSSLIEIRPMQLHDKLTTPVPTPHANISFGPMVFAPQLNTQPALPPAPLPQKRQRIQVVPKSFAFDFKIENLRQGNTASYNTSTYGYLVPRPAGSAMQCYQSSIPQQLLQQGSETRSPYYCGGSRGVDDRMYQIVQRRDRVFDFPAVSNETDTTTTIIARCPIQYTRKREATGRRNGEP